jgi:hypothetical protein
MGSCFLIECISNGVSAYYARGMFLTNIPLETAESVRLIKWTQNGKKSFEHNYMPAFCRFQRLWKAWYHLVKNPRTYLQREIGSTALKRFSPRKYLQ